MKIVLIGGHPKGFDEPFNIKTKSGKVLRKITGDLKIEPIFFDLWDNQEDQDEGVIREKVKEELLDFIKKKYKLVALGKFVEKALKSDNIEHKYLPHPASRDIKFLKRLKEGLDELNR